MDIYASEKEQVEVIKKWIKENGVSVLTGVLLGLAAVTGGRAWFSYQDRQAAEAANLYARLINSLSIQRTAEVSQIGGEIVGRHGGTPYAVLASLAMAKASLAEENPSGAQVHLHWALEHGKSDALRHVARQRLIRILLAEGALEQAGQLLDEAQALPDLTPGFSRGYKELRGDLLLAAGDPAGAREAYVQAIAGLPPGYPYRKLLELKLGEAGSAGSVESPL